jgi:hypothetical protein
MSPHSNTLPGQIVNQYPAARPSPAAKVQTAFGATQSIWDTKDAGMCDNLGGHHSHNTPNHTQPHPVPLPAPLAAASNVSAISSTGCSPLASATFQSPLDRCITMLVVAGLLMVCGLASSTSVVSGSGIFHVSVALRCPIPKLTPKPKCLGPRPGG